jgi:hypothetical protein
MKTTIDVPEQLLRQTKAYAALKGLTIREIVIGAMERTISGNEEISAAHDKPDWLAEWNALGKRISPKWTTRKSAVELVREGRR